MYIVFSLLDLVTQAFLHPLRIYHDESYFHLFYFIENCIYVLNLTRSIQCWSNSSFVSPPTTGIGLDPNPRLYQALRGIKSPEVETSSQVLHVRSYSRRGLHLGRFDPSGRFRYLVTTMLSMGGRSTFIIIYLWLGNIFIIHFFVHLK